MKILISGKDIISIIIIEINSLTKDSIIIYIQRYRHTASIISKHHQQW